MGKDAKIPLGMSADAKVRPGMSKDANVRLGMSAYAYKDDSIGWWCWWTHWDYYMIQGPEPLWDFLQQVITPCETTGKTRGGTPL